MPTLNNLNVVFIRDRDGNFTPVNGFMGSPGRGIVSIERTSGDGTSGSIDVYTITYTDKTTSTFEVYNGSDGKSGATPEQIAAAIEQYLTENPFVKKETDPTVFRWAKAELFDKNDLVDPAGRNSFVTIDDIEYYRYNASAQNFEWNNPNPQTGSVTITARGMSQYGGTGSTRLRTFFDDGTEGEQLFIIVNGESRTVTYTTPSDKVLAKITGNYDMENWVLLDMSVMSCLADYPAPKGTVKTVNGISPDGNGNIQFDAADVNAVAQNQGAENAGKFLSINESGEVIPVESGADGITPHIGANGNWYIGETDTGIKAQGENGADGTTPHIGDNGDWYIGETDTGIKAQGEKGEKGDPGEKGTTPHIGENGNWWIGDTDTGVKAVASGGSGTDIALGITGAAVGQIARITAVDDTGIPTAWEAVDTLRLLARVETDTICSAIEISGINTKSDVISVRLFKPGSSCGNGWNVTINEETKLGFVGSVMHSNNDNAQVKGWIYKIDGKWVSRTVMSNNGLNIANFSHGQPIEKLAFKPHYNDGETKYFDAGAIIEIYEGVYPNVV